MINHNENENKNEKQITLLRPKKTGPDIDAKKLIIKSVSV